MAPELAVDPVCGRLVSRRASAAGLAWRGRLYHFCTLTCLFAFQADPKRYAAAEHRDVRAPSE